MATVYTAFDPTKPDQSTQNGVAFGNSTKNNLLAVRDMVVMFGMVPGWNYSFSGGTSDKPTDAKFSRSISGTTNWVKLTHTYDGSNRPTKIACYYSSDNESSYDALDDDSGNYVINFTYDSNGLQSTNWNSTP